MTQLLASVVIPTYNRADLLSRTLDRLLAQDIDPARFEVLVGDDGSSDTTPQVVDAYADRLRLRYRWQSDDGFRVAAARNLAAGLAQAPLLIFLDSGELPVRGLLRAHLDAHGGDGSRAVLGLVYGYEKRLAGDALGADEIDSDPDEHIRLFRASGRKTDVREHDFRAVDDDLSRYPAPWAYFWSGNISVPTAAFRAVGGFDESFVGWGGEDTELSGACTTTDCGSQWPARPGRSSSRTPAMPRRFWCRSAATPLGRCACTPIPRWSW